MSKSKQLCVGCKDDFYNGKNPWGVKECWSYRSAKVVTRTQVGIWQNPPYEWRPQQTFDCHCPEHSTTWIKRDDVRISAKAKAPA